MSIKSKIRTVSNWPKAGIQFRDITTLLKDPIGFNDCINNFINRYELDPKCDIVVGIDSRGFIIGGAIAYALGVGFVPIRKKGKLPAETEKEEYCLEYGKDSIEIHKDAIIQDQQVLIVDDLIATGGTAIAAGNLVKRLGGIVYEFAFIIDLPDLGGRKKLEDLGYSTYTQTSFEGE